MYRVTIGKIIVLFALLLSGTQTLGAVPKNPIDSLAEKSPDKSPSVEPSLKGGDDEDDSSGRGRGRGRGRGGSDDESSNNGDSGNNSGPGGGNDDDVNDDNENSSSSSTSDDDGSDSSTDSSLALEDDLNEDIDAARALIDRIVINGNSITIYYKNGWAESLGPQMYELRDQKDRRVIRRRANRNDTRRFSLLQGKN